MLLFKSGCKDSFSCSGATNFSEKIFQEICTRLQQGKTTTLNVSLPARKRPFKHLSRYGNDFHGF
jgi:hypothetical protein